MPAEPTRQRKRVIYSGRVQGVGFRMNTVDLARHHPVVGFVRNDPAGTVTLEAEGSPDALDQFITDLDKHFSHNIADKQTSDLTPRNDEPTFEIRY